MQGIYSAAVETALSRVAFFIWVHATSSITSACTCTRVRIRIRARAIREFARARDRTARALLAKNTIFVRSFTTS